MAPCQESLGLAMDGQPYVVPLNYAYIDGRILFHTARAVSDVGERTKLLNEFNRRFDPEAEAISRARAERCGAVEIRVTEMTGRRERDRQNTYWRHSFDAHLPSSSVSDK